MPPPWPRTTARPRAASPFPSSHPPLPVPPGRPNRAQEDLTPVRRPDYNRRVVITGLGAVCPIGNDLETIWSNLLNGVSGIGEITHFDTTPYEHKAGGEVRGFDVTQYMNFKDAR